ncbi:hypothetical protein [Rodent Torque teno virus 3]|uniref:Uncharacterized protein n=1 Tax=Rodent Torque teno virus 3 TaxID=2054610 RepID=A0A2H4QBE5_9VIRU|nr:hypothetical protein [Rodent Torque teno virus 3]ATX61868.1 hypothetical protein [Rodent Torque teno virus 3]
MKFSAAAKILLTIFLDGVLLPALGRPSPLWLQELEKATVVPETVENKTTPLPGKETPQAVVETENQACTCHAMEPDQQKEMYHSWILSFSILLGWPEGDNGFHLPREQADSWMARRRCSQQPSVSPRPVLGGEVLESTVEQQQSRL